MKVLAICASAKTEGPSVRSLRRALAILEPAGHATELVVLPGLEIKFCTHCAECDNVETCPIGDDVWPLYLKMKAADMIILATPLASGSAMVMLKAVLERAGRIARLNGRQFRDKHCALLILEFGEGLELTKQQLGIWCRLMQLRPPYAASIVYRGRHNRETIRASEAERGQAAEDFGRELARRLVQG